MTMFHWIITAVAVFASASTSFATAVFVNLRPDPVSVFNVSRVAPNNNQVAYDQVRFLGKVFPGKRVALRNGVYALIDRHGNPVAVPGVKLYGSYPTPPPNAAVTNFEAYSVGDWQKAINNGWRSTAFMEVEDRSIAIPGNAYYIDSKNPIEFPYHLVGHKGRKSEHSFRHPTGRFDVAYTELGAHKKTLKSNGPYVRIQDNGVVSVYGYMNGKKGWYGGEYTWKKSRIKGSVKAFYIKPRDASLVIATPPSLSLHVSAVPLVSSNTLKPI